MNRVTRISSPRAAASAGVRLGERLRQLRVAAGLTQSELAGARFSKEYVSQIERGKTRPARETIEWLAEGLGVDADFLANGVTAHHPCPGEGPLPRGEALTEANREEEALAEFEDVRTAVLATGLPELEVRALCGEAEARVGLGAIREAIELLTRARALTERQEFSDLERADVLWRLGVCRYKLSSIQTALGLFNEARALELAQGLNDRRGLANIFFQASIVAEREGHWVLARTYAERAKAQYEELADRTNVGRLLNNLGGINFLLGRPDEAIAFLKDAFRAALDVGDEADAARAVSSLAQVHLRRGDAVVAEEQARHAIGILEGRVDFLDELGNAQLVLGRALLDQDRLDEAAEWFGHADSSYEQLSSISHRATVWVAQGDLATRRGEDREAALQYRRAA